MPLLRHRGVKEAGACTKKSSLSTGNSSGKGPKAGVSFECSGNIQEASYLIPIIALRVSYNYPHSPDEEHEAQRGWPRSQKE